MDQTELKLIISAQDNASAALKTLNGSLGDIGRAGGTISTTFSNIGQRFSTEFKAAGIGVTALGSALAYSIKQSMSFDEQMKLIQTQAGASAEEVKVMSAAILSMGGQTTQTPEDLAKGLYHIESAGLRGTSAIDMLKVASQGAMVGQADLESVSNALIATIESGVGGVKDYTDGMGQLNAIVGAGNMRMQDLADSMGSGILSAAKNFGVSLSDVGAALATMTTQGVPAVDAATRLKMTFSLMAAPTSKAAKELEGIGMSATQMADDIRTGGLGSALEDLQKHLVDSGETATQQAATLSHAFGGGRSATAIMTLVQNTGMFNDKLKQITGSAGQFGDTVKAAEEDPMTKFKMLMGEMQTEAIKLGNEALPLVNHALDEVGKWFEANQGNIQKFFDDASVAIDNFAKKMAVVTQFVWDHRTAILAIIGVYEGLKVALSIIELVQAVSAAYTILTTSTALASAATATFGVIMAVVTSPITLIVLAVAAVGVAIYLLWKNWSTIWPAIVAFATPILQGFANFFGGIWDSIKSAWQGFITYMSTKFLGDLGTAIGLLLGLWMLWPEMIGSALAHLGTYIWDNVMVPAWKYLEQNFPKWIDAMLKWFSDLPGRAVKALISMGSSISSAFSGAWDTVSKAFPKWIDAVLKFFSDLPDKVVKALGNLGDALYQAFKGAFDWLGSKWDELTGGIGKGFNKAMKAAGLAQGGTVQAQGRAQGGMIFASTGFDGQGVGSDSVPAMLTPGEMVLTTTQQTALFNLLNGAPSQNNRSQDSNPTYNFNFQGAIIGDKTALINMVKDAISRQQEQLRLGIV